MAERKREAHLPSLFCPVNPKLFIEKVQEITRVQKEVIDLEKKKKNFYETMLVTIRKQQFSLLEI